MSRNLHGDAVIIFLLILVAVIPISTFLFVRGRSAVSTGNIDQVKELPLKTLTTKLREIVYYDQALKKEVRYWALDTTNHGTETLYNCYAILEPKGSKDKYYGFSKNYSLRDCNKLGNTRDNYECRLGNAINKFRYSESAKVWDKIPAKGNLIIAVSRFYTEQTVTSMSFLTKYRLSDMLDLVPLCKTAKGDKVKQIIQIEK